MVDTKVNLCDACLNTFPECFQDEIEFGDGFGNDNVIKCSSYNNGEGTKTKEANKNG